MKHVHSYSTLSVSFSYFSIIVSVSDFLVCTQWSCHENDLGIIYGISFISSYIISTFFLYLTFIDRLFDPYYRPIYQYSLYIRSILWMLLFILILTMIALDIDYGFQKLFEDYGLDSILFDVFATTDIIIIISVLTTLLFFCPICRQNRMHSNHADISALKKYGILSALQLFAAVSFQMSLLSQSFLWLIDTEVRIMRKVNYSTHVLKMLDCLLLMICIHFGFVRNQTVCGD